MLMPYMNCARCGLSVRLRADQLCWEACPRCLGRTGTSVPIYISGRRTWSTADRPTDAIASGAVNPARSHV
jgi:hypothetical protein